MYNQFKISIWSWQPWFQMELNYLQSDLAWHNYRNMICTFCHRNKIPHITWCIHENQELQPFFCQNLQFFLQKCAYPKIHRTTTVVHESYLFSIQYVIQRLQLTYSVLKRLVLLAEAPYYGILFIVWDFFAIYLIIIVFLK